MKTTHRLPARFRLCRRLKPFKITVLFLLFGLQSISLSAQQIENSMETGKKKAADSSAVDSLVHFAWNNKYAQAETAYANALSAFNTSRQIKYNKGILDACNYLGQQMADWTDYTQALYYYQLGLNAAEQAGDSRQIMRFYLLIGQLFDDEEEYPSALEWYDKTMRTALSKNDSLFASYAAGDKAIIMDKTGHTDSSYLYDLQALGYLANGVGTGLDSAHTFMNLALNRKRQHHFDKARDYMLQSKPLITHSTDTFSIQVWYSNMGSLCTAMGRLAEAKANLDTALSLRPVVRSKYINEDLYKNVSQYYEAKKDYAAALDWYKKSRVMTDSIRQEKQTRQFAALRTRYEVDKKESLLAEQDLELRQRKWISIIAFAGAFLLLILAILLFLGNRKRKKINKLLSAKNEQISSQKEKLQQVNHVKDRLFSIISHDLKSPLQSLLFYLKLLTDHKLSREDIHHTAGELQRHFHHTRNMIDNLLYWASTQIRGWQLHPRNLTVTPVLKDVLDILAPEAKRKNILLSDELPEGLTAFSDEDMLRLALRNILSNAIKFTPEGGRICITGKKDQCEVCISITDNGIGIAPDKLEQFRQGAPLPNSPGTSQEAGTGLGILISKQFLEKQSGRLDIESAPGKGTSVYICLPAGRAAVLPREENYPG